MKEGREGGGGGVLKKESVKEIARKKEGLNGLARERERERERERDIMLPQWNEYKKGQLL